MVVVFGFSKSQEEEKVKKLNESKLNLEKEIEKTQKEIDDLEDKMGYGTAKFLQAKVEDERELENLYEVIEIYEEQLKNINKNLEKIIKKNRR